MFTVRSFLYFPCFFLGLQGTRQLLFFPGLQGSQMSLLVPGRLCCCAGCVLACVRRACCAACLAAVPTRPSSAFSSCQCSSIDNTRVEPAMPGCAARSMPKVSSSMLTAVQRARLGGAAVQVQSGTTFSAALATVLGSVAVCTVAGLLLWRRGKCGSWLRRGERQPLLLSQRRGGASLPAPAFAPGAAAVHPVRRARLMSVLASAAAEGSGRGIEMMPVRALSTVLAHQLSASSGRAVLAGAAGPPSEPANGEEESLRLLPPGREHLRGAGQSAVGREWGLETTSLLLEAEELEVRRGV